MSAMEESAGKLTIVPTPIGNLGDITARAKGALGECDAIYAEDTRITGRLLANLGISKPLHRLDENTMAQKAPEALERVQAGEAIAYCTDAGMPGVSDPGLRLVALAHEMGAPVEVLPGASALTVAYVASGVTAPRLFFGAFLPRKATETIALVNQLKGLDAALVFYESPHRIVASLEAIRSVLPERRVAVCRELTKLHEEVIRGSIGEVIADLSARDAIRGEIALVIWPPAADEEALPLDDELLLARARELYGAGAAGREVRRALQDEFGISKNRAYDIAVQAKPDQSAASHGA